jgi:hypothetical protein
MAVGIGYSKEESEEFASVFHRSLLNENSGQLIQNVGFLF